MPTKDVEKLRSYRNKWYRNNKEKAKEQVRLRKDEIKRWFLEHKSSLKCARCPENHIACLDFHHVNPDEKDIILSQCVTNGWSIKRIEEELAKCIVLCSNCHRKHHFDEKQV